MKYLISLNKITLGQIEELYDQGYKLEFHYNANLPYVEFWKRA